MNIIAFGILCAISVIAEFCLAGFAYEKEMWSPAAILAMSMAFCGIICSVFTYSVIFWG